MSSPFPWKWVAFLPFAANPGFYMSLAAQFGVWNRLYTTQSCVRNCLRVSRLERRRLSDPWLFQQLVTKPIVVGGMVFSCMYSFVALSLWISWICDCFVYLYPGFLVLRWLPASLTCFGGVVCEFGLWMNLVVLHGHLPTFWFLTYYAWLHWQPYLLELSLMLCMSRILCRDRRIFGYSPTDSDSGI